MAIVIDLATRRRISPAPEASFGIIRGDDPELQQDLDTDGSFVLVDGLVPRELAAKMVAMCEEYNRSLVLN